MCTFLADPLKFRGLLSQGTPDDRIFNERQLCLLSPLLFLNSDLLLHILDSNMNRMPVSSNY